MPRRDHHDDEHRTPLHIFQRFGQTCTLDVASTKDNALCQQYFTLREDGLSGNRLAARPAAISRQHSRTATPCPPAPTRTQTTRCAATIVPMAAGEQWAIRRWCSDGQFASVDVEQHVTT